MDKSLHVNPVKPEDKASNAKKLPLFKYEPDSKYTGKLWILAAIMLAICAILYVIGLVLPSAPLTGAALFLLLVSGIVIFLMNRKMKKANHVMTEKEIDEIVENYKVDLINTFNGYDLDYDAKDILTAADDYRKLLEQDNGIEELDENESLVSIFKKMVSDSQSTRQKRKNEKKAEKEQRKADKAYVKAAKKQEKSK